MKMRIIIILAATFACSIANAQSWPVSDIPESLKENSDAVIRSEITVVESNDPASATEKYSVVITVLSNRGESNAGITIYTDSYRSLKSFSGEMFDASGKSIKKIRKSDLQVTEVFSGLASDTRYHYYVPVSPTYPYTVRYEYERVNKNGMLSYMGFMPVRDYGVALQEASYKLILPDGVPFYYRSLNHDIKPKETSSGASKIYEWAISDFPSVSSEPYGTIRTEILPIVYMSPHDFVFAGKAGNMQDWQAYSRWQWELLEDRGQLPEELKTQVKEMTKNTTSDREKVEILYDYLGRNTRYVSLQIGIGGFQPMSATEVYTTKFGDCKALSNYMRMMLEECGIESFYSEIGVNTVNLMPDFVSASMSDHVILKIPLEDETIWMECTNTKIPLGYIHTGIAGRNALVYKDGSAHVEQVPVYPDSLNASSLIAYVEVHEDGSADSKVENVYNMQSYENSMGFITADATQRLNAIRSQLNFPFASVSDIAIHDARSSAPHLKISYNASSDRVGSATGNRIFVNLNLFKKSSGIRLTSPDRRKSDIIIRQGGIDSNVIVLNIPESMTIEGVPESYHEENDFGEFSFDIKTDGNTITVSRSLRLNSGTYPLESYPLFKNFMDAVDRYSNSSTLVLRNN